MATYLALTFGLLGLGALVMALPFTRWYKEHTRARSNIPRHVERLLIGLTGVEGGARELLSFLGEHLLSLGVYPRILLFLLDRRRKNLEGVWAGGFGEEFSPEDLLVPLGEGSLLADALASRRHPVVERRGVLTALQLEPGGDDPPALLAPLAPEGSRRHAGEGAYGLLVVFKEKGRHFSDDEKATLHAIAATAGALLENKVLLTDIATREREIGRRVYEISILKEIGERIGYSLNVQNIIDIITGSLGKLLTYSVAAYMTLEPEKTIFRCHLEESVSRSFIRDVASRMLASLAALTGRDCAALPTDEFLSGTIIAETGETPVRSYFNIPLVINEKVVGLITVASQASGLYREDEMTILYKITAQASVAVSRLAAVIEEQEKKLSSMIESMADGVVMIDPEYRILAINPAAKHMLSLAHAPDITIFELVSALAGKVDLREKLTDSLKKNILIAEKELYLTDRVLQMLVSPVQSKTGQVFGSVVLFHDVTKEKELERLREDFTAMMVHELRSPLNGIKSMIELLRDEQVKAKKETYDEFTKLIYHSSSTMLELVNDLLDVAKLESGKFDIILEEGNLEEVLRDRLSYFSTLAKDKGVSLGLEVPHPLSHTRFDPRRISQVLNNLLSNAIKFTTSGGRVIVQALPHQREKVFPDEVGEARLSWRYRSDTVPALPRADVVFVAVTDTGRGIPPDGLAKLFSKFQQLSALRKSHEKGTGLGLVIAKGIVEAHNGKIGVVSEEGKGSTFWFTLPL